MSGRHRLPNRREHHLIEFEFNGARYRCGFSHFPEGALAEIFLATGKVNSELEIAAHDSAIVCSIALQHGVPLTTIRHALLANDDGAGASALAHAVDLIDAAGYLK